MPSDYARIRADNELEYGAGVGRWGKSLLTDRYDDRTHFIFELLQNAEDALARRVGWQGSRRVSFTLSTRDLRVTHNGRPFNENDVRGICGIAESTKDLTAIGRFGIGFKSVYAFTDRPEVHSGGEDFAIKDFVLPFATRPTIRRPDETIFVLPMRSGDATAPQEIAAGVQRLGPRALLFLRQIEEIKWRVVDGPSGLYLRNNSPESGALARRVTLLGEEDDKPNVEETWLVFSREVKTDEGVVPGYVEIAFSIAPVEESDGLSVEVVGDSSLVAFFPTVVPTNLGFLVQGPYRTTPSRDNVPRTDPWNQRLVIETASLLVEALRWLRDQNFLDTAALGCLPLERTKFAEGTMFAPLFEATKKALTSEPLLPRYDVGHVPAIRALLSRTEELRDLFAPSQLGALFKRKHELAWLTSDITQDRAPGLRRYLVQELGVTEFTPETIIPKLDKPFLQAQPDTWILALYEFLNGQPALRSRLEGLPLIRLQDGSHVLPRANGQPQAFLPGRIATEFPCVRAAVCATETAREFLRTLGLTVPDPVDDVVRNVLPRYREDEVDDGDYETDIRRILEAFATDSKFQKEKLITALRQAAFVMAVDAGDGTKWVAKPGEVYLATDRLKELFTGVTKVLLVDDSYPSLRGEDVRELLEACGASRYLQTIPAEAGPSWAQLMEIRRNAGLERYSWARPVADVTVRGLPALLGLLPRLDPHVQRRKASLLWEALADLESRRVSTAFVGAYTWGYSHETKTASFDAAFVRELNGTAWVPDATEQLQRPEFVLFDTLGWKPNPFLQSKIAFKPPIIEMLAREAGIESGVLDLLKKIGVTSEAELRKRLGLQHEAPAVADESVDQMDDVRTKVIGNPGGRTPPGTVLTGPEGSVGARGSQHADDYDRRPERMGRGGTSIESDGEGGRGKETEERDRKHTPGSASNRPFISYVGVQPDEEDTDPDGLDHSARMSLEASAIAFILSHEPQWVRTPTHNRGYDLFEAAGDGQASRWCEVKAMTGSLRGRPIGLSRTQFEHAQKHGAAYWLYIVEHAGTDNARIVRIQDPAGNARTFTFDHGWLAVADTGQDPL